MQDRRETILNAGLAILREEGLSSFTQPKVAARANLRQGNLTYYFPTRTDLLAAVARLAIDAQKAAAHGMVEAISNPGQAAAAIAANASNHEKTRLLAALNQAADHEPVVQALFKELDAAFAVALGELLGKLGLAHSEVQTDLIHALFVGLSIINLATDRERAEARAKAVLETGFASLAKEPPTYKRKSKR